MHPKKTGRRNTAAKKDITCFFMLFALPDVEEFKVLVEVERIYSVRAVARQNYGLETFIHVGHFKADHALRAGSLQGFVPEFDLACFGQLDEKVRFRALGAPVLRYFAHLAGDISLAFFQPDGDIGPAFLFRLFDERRFLRRRGPGLVREDQLVFEFLLLDIPLDLRAVDEIPYQHLIDLDPLGRQFGVQDYLSLVGLVYALKGVIEILGRKLAESGFESRFGFRDDAVVLEKLSRTDLGERQVRVFNAVQYRNVHVHEKAVRSLDMSGFLYSGAQGGRIGILRQFQNLLVPGKSEHRLRTGDNGVQAGPIDLCLDAAMHPYLDHLDPVFIGFDIYCADKIGDHEQKKRSGRDL